MASLHPPFALGKKGSERVMREEPGLGHRPIARLQEGAHRHRVGSVAVTAGASAPEALVERILEALRARYNVTLETMTTASESMTFSLPRDLREPA